MEGQGQRAVFFFILLLFIILTPDQPPRRRFRLGDNHLEVTRQQDLDVLANSTYGDFDGQQKWLNLTGFREGDGYRWENLPKVQEQSQRQWSASLQSAGGDLVFYNEVTGEVRGNWTRSDLSVTAPQPLNLTALDPRKEYISSFWQRNVTEHDGEITMVLHDDLDKGPAPRQLRADVGLYSVSSPGNGWQANLEGVHLPGGAAILSTATTKFDALPALAHFALNKQSFEQIQLVMNKTVSELWQRKIDQEPEVLGLPHCELIVFLQPRAIVPPGAAAGVYVNQVESELSHPEGAPIGVPPPLSYSAIVFSPDCGYVLEAEALYGPKVEAFSRLAGRLLVALVIVLSLQILLLKRQTELAATPSTRSRISYQGIAIAALGDGMLFLAMVALLMLDEAGFLVVAAAVFLALIHVAFLEVKFIFDIWTVQVGDPMRAEYERLRRIELARPEHARPAPAAEAPTELPLPATAPRITDGATPIMIASDGELVQFAANNVTFSTIYSRFYFTLLCLTFISLWALSWPRPLRSGYTNLLIFTYFSLWWPQIYRNTMRNCRKALTWEYVLGSTLLRTIPTLYWYISPRNILSVENSQTTAAILLAWIWLQVLILISQQFLGPRLLARESWCDSAYDYHPVLREDSSLEGGGAGAMSIGLLASASEAKDQHDKTRKVFDCAICMNEIDVPVVSSGTGEGGGGARVPWLEQRNYMVTPCRHIFHAECLEGWMCLRLVCPVCRESLPPL